MEWPKGRYSKQITRQVASLVETAMKVTGLPFKDYGGIWKTLMR